MRRTAFRLAFLACLSGCATETCVVEQAASVPITFAHGHMTVAASLNGSDATMVLDTGAEHSLLSPEVAARLGLPPDPGRQTRTIGVTGAFTTTNVWLETLAVGGVAAPRQSAAVGAPGDGSGHQEDGLLGADWLDQFDVEIDGPGRRLLLYRVAGCDGVEYPPWAGKTTEVTGARRFHDGLMVVPVALAGHTLTAILDTGTPQTLLRARAAARLGLSEAVLAADPQATIAGADHQPGLLHQHRFAAMTVAGETLTDPVVGIAPMQLREADMLLGQDYLAGRRVWLSWLNGRVFVQAAGAGK